jgi:hypothetical protein
VNEKERAGDVHGKKKNSSHSRPMCPLNSMTRSIPGELQEMPWGRNIHQKSLKVVILM